jgi:hypothetical protein
MGFLRTEHRALIDSVKIVRKRYADTGKMNCLGFATFATLQSAQDFVESRCVCPSPSFHLWCLRIAATLLCSCPLYTRTLSRGRSGSIMPPRRPQLAKPIKPATTHHQFRRRGVTTACEMSVSPAVGNAYYSCAASTRGPMVMRLSAGLDRRSPGC